MNTTTETAKATFLRTKGRLLTAIDATPDDKLNWSASPSSRTPLELFVHSIDALQFLHNSFKGVPAPKLSTAEFDSSMRAEEKNTKTKEAALARFEDLSNSYVAWLDEVSDATLEGVWNSPFGEVPMTVAIGFPAMHTEGHISQIEYVQTIYGDRVWH